MTPKSTYDQLKRKIKRLEKEVDKYKQVEQALRKSEERNRTLLENVDIGVYRTGPHGQFLQANPAAVKIFGYDSLDDLIEVSTSELYRNTEDRDLFSQKIKKDGFVRNEEMKLRQKDGSIVWCSVTATIQYDEHGEIQLIDGAIEDITERKRIEGALQESERRLGDIIDFLPDATFAIDSEGKVIAWNRAIEEMTGIRAEYMLGKGEYEYALPFYGVRRPILIDLALKPEEEIGKEISFVSRKGDCLIIELDDPIIVGGKEMFMWGKASPVYDSDGNIIGAIESVRDINDNKKTEKALQKSKEKYQKLSLIDDLTKLYNSRHFYNQLKSEIKRVNRYNHPLTLLMLDVDNFKKYNDSFGHLEGNKVLAQLGKLIRKSMRSSDSAYRYGGEEFMVILPETEGSKGMLVAERIRSDFKDESFHPAAEMIVHLTISIGIAQYINQEDLTDFIKRADENMYKAKEQGKDRLFFNGRSNYSINQNAKQTIYKQRFGSF